MKFFDDDSDKHECFFYPGATRCQYDSLDELIAEQRLKGYGGGFLFLNEIVEYNVRYRNCLREKGIEGAIAMLISDCPSLAKEQKDLDGLRDWWTRIMEEQIADYDIQCLPRDSKWYILGCPFEGLRDVQNQTEMSGCPTHDEANRWSPSRKFEPNPMGLHVGEIWKSYPMFDSYDAGDGRYYQNFIFRNHPLTPNDMQVVADLRGPLNECRVHEFIPHHLLPILYYDGDSDSVLLATER